MLITIDLTEEQVAALQVADGQRSYPKTPIVNDPKDVADYLAHLKHLKQEHSMVVGAGDCAVRDFSVVPVARNQGFDRAIGHPQAVA